MGDETTGTHATVLIQPVPAATRAVGTDRYVCPVGWSSEVFELSGAAAAVWSYLDGVVSLATVAERCGVEESDDFFVTAVAMLIDVGLLREHDGNPLP